MDCQIETKNLKPITLAEFGGGIPRSGAPTTRYGRSTGATPEKGEKVTASPR